MSIDAIVMAIRADEGELHLEAADPKRGPAGQETLYFDPDKAPADLWQLYGRHIWGGTAQIMIGDTQIANRLGHTTIEFIVKRLGPLMKGQGIYVDNLGRRKRLKEK